MEAARIAISITGVVLIACALRMLVLIHHELQRIGRRQAAELKALHILAADDDDVDARSLHSVPQRRG